MTLIRSTDAKISNRITRYLPLPYLRGLYGFVLALGAPIGWVVLQWLAGRDPFAPQHFDTLLYAYMTGATAVVFACLGFAIGRREQMITDMALTDGLTALYNKRYFKNRLEQEFLRHQRSGNPMSVIQVDLDHFKSINDTWGHQAGDVVLKKVASVILANCRKNEIAARVGGEEISIIACECGPDEAKALAERLRLAIEATPSHWQGQPISVTASMGIASVDRETDNAWQVYEHADKALYRAKQAGRNRSCLY